MRAATQTAHWKDWSPAAKLQLLAQLREKQPAFLFDPPPAPSLAEYVSSTVAYELEDWQKVICARLESFAEKKGQRLLLHAPPQVGKSIIVSQRFPSWLLGKDPVHRVRLACYNLVHAKRFASVNVNLMRAPEYRKAFPSPLCQIPKDCAVAEWSTKARAETLDGQASFMALGLGSGFTGSGVDTLIVDDPYKSKTQAFSTATNEFIMDWWNEVAKQRFNPETNAVVMFHRWKVDDFAGRLLDTGEWEYMRFPAIADGIEECAGYPAADPMGRAVGEVLSPRYPRTYLDPLQVRNPAVFVSLQQGLPVPREGNMFKRSWFDGKKLQAIPKTVKLVRYWDKAFTEDGGAYTAGVLMGITRTEDYVVLDVQQFQLAETARDEKILAIAKEDKKKYGRAIIYLEQEPGPQGRDSNKKIIKKLKGFTAHSDPVKEDKVTRAEDFASQAKAGNVYYLEAEWNDLYLSQLCSFPGGKFKDMVDASSGAANVLALAPVRGIGASGGSRVLPAVR